MKDITLKARIDNIPKVTAFIDGELEALECSVKAQMQIDVAIDELFGNIARYAYGDEEGDATVSFDFDADTRTALITFADWGKPFDPTAAAAPDISTPAAERRIGGLGIFLVRKTMDDMRYAYRDGKNILTVRKKI
ncbi:MAG: ATP-binding protein [Clostridia bacterium]|nr:ATP-binding protein [Clostridia bacterium]